MGAFVWIEATSPAGGGKDSRRPPEGAGGVAAVGRGDIRASAAKPATLTDRSVIVALKRRLPSERITPFRSDRVSGLRALARQAARWTRDNETHVAANDPEMPVNLAQSPNKMAGDHKTGL